MARRTARRRSPGDRIRVTHVVVGDAFAGTERYVCDVAGELARRGHDVRVVGGAPSRMPALLGPGVGWSPGDSSVDALRALLRGGRRDLVHGHLTKGEFVAFAGAPATRGRRVATRHILASRGYSGVARLIGRVVRRELAAEIAVSEFVARQVRPRPDAVLLNGVVDVPDEAAAQPAAEGPPTVLLAQRLEDEKQTDVAIRAWARSGLAAAGGRLRLAGDGIARPALTSLVAELGVQDSVDFLGRVDDVPALMRASTVFLATAPAEPCGLSVLEAMAHGLPVVAAAGGGHCETVGSHPEARLFPIGDAEACADALVGLARNAAERGRYGAELRGLQRERFSLSVHVDQLERLYRAALRS
jgi:glycosyltransferase involved in cell wall biosynthesis